MDIAVVGAGVTGATVARRFADNGHTVRVYEKAIAPGGMATDVPVADFFVNVTGPHIFYTDDREVYEWISRFARWLPIEHRVMTKTHLGWMNWPINLSAIEFLHGNLKMWEAYVKGCKQRKVATPSFESAAIADIGEPLYNTFLREYTTKMWGKPPSQLSPNLYKRVRVRDTYEDRLLTERFVGLPRGGFTNWAKSMLAHKNIEVEYNHTVDWVELQNLGCLMDVVVSTAPLDDWYPANEFLYYHGVRFDTYHDYDDEWPTAVVNFPMSDVKYTRGTDYARMWSKPGSYRIVEVPDNVNGHLFYPRQTPEAVHEAHSFKHALSTKGIYSVGRLGGYEYIDMAPAIRKALDMADWLNS